MSSEAIIKVHNVSKCYQIYDRPNDRLKQGLFSLAARLCPITTLKQSLLQKAHACSRQYWALHDVSFELKKGGAFGIIGRNGSGKSTLLQILCGTLNPTHGSVEIHGRVAALLELGSGFNPEYTGRENIYMNGQLLGLSREQIDERIDDIIAFAEIGEFIEQPVKTYSSGMFVRVAFAVIAHVDADILVIDEALAVGDAFFTQKCMRFLRNFMETGTILFVSHDTAAVKSLCEHAIWLEKGQMQLLGTAKDVSERYLQAFYESVQGRSTTTRMRPTATSVPILPAQRRDARADWINQSNLRNDIRLFEFDEKAASFGTRDAAIHAVEFFDQEGQPLSWVVGGEPVTFRMKAMLATEIYSPILGFYIKDKLGQILFGDNTYLTYQDTPLSADANTLIEAEFEFIMPILPKGDYSVCVAIAAGSNENHTQLEWMHDAMILRSESTYVATGLVGVPMQSIVLRTVNLN
ncbi:ABC transporter ATP-binding protein [Undibacterium sp. 14-3-2]|uniref:ABC transporter ATP-binding protein n=1 Tax=Undibacterium sp. 14-3-2 TaxID=2800129 RepID=UPI0019065E64|nr:ABC transporter ATP-binding protein [Undibacterium sp. 14-3-2]MBK1890241.1 ABC transporter ATP-binding protein [Undibacterium sp. 14-3-2]